MFPLASIFSEILTGLGSAAAVMAIGIFLGQASPTLVGASEATVRRRATFGGIFGLGFGLVVVVLSAIFG